MGYSNACPEREDHHLMLSWKELMTIGKKMVVSTSWEVAAVVGFKQNKFKHL
jgi:hypothetical protein